jgi:hypothetical protein
MLNLWMDRGGLISVFDAQGSRVYQSQHDSGLQRIRLAGLKPGNYTLVTASGTSQLIVR